MQVNENKPTLKDLALQLKGTTDIYADEEYNEWILTSNFLQTLRRLDSVAEKNLEKVLLASELIELAAAVNLTIDKFEEAIKEPNPELKAEILSYPCGICFFYEENHSKCIYKTRCEGLFKDAEFKSAKEMNKFVGKEIAFCNLLKNSIFEWMDNLPDTVPKTYIKIGSVKESFERSDAKKSQRRAETLRKWNKYDLP